MDVALVRTDLDHLTELGRIETRRLAAMDEVSRLLKTTRDGLALAVQGRSVDESLESTLNTLRSGPRSDNARKRLENTLYLLNNYAALCARAATIAGTRMLIESRRHGIRRDATVAQSYEAVLTSGAQRIAAY